MIDQYAEVLYNQKVNATYNEELYVVEGLPKSVDVTLIGQKRHIFLAKQSPSKGVTVDLTGLKPGNHKVNLKYSERIKSLDYKLDPSEVTVTIYEKVSDTKSLTVDILHKDDLDSKLHIYDVSLNRDTVIIKGAKYMLDKVATVRALVDVDEINNPEAGTITLKKVPLVAYDTDGNVLDVEVVPKTVSAKVVIISPSKEVPIKVVPTGTVALGKAISTLSPSSSTVVVYGDEDALNKIDSIEVPIDVKNLDSNKNYNVTLSKPNGVTELSIKDITINVTLSSSITKEFNDIAITTKNLNSKYKVQALSEADSKVSVVVTGSEDLINKLNSSDITAYLDLKNYGVGEHEVDVKVKGNDLRLTYTSKTKKVKVKITQ
jgi:YbbR domain-containing protein